MSFTIDFRPRQDGLPYDPATFGGSVDLVRVYSDAARTVQVQVTGPAVRISAGLYRFTLEDLPDGTYYTSITWTQRAGATPYTDSNDRITLPVPDPLIARLRRMTAEPDRDGDYGDGDLARVLDDNTDALGRVDVFAAAADVWEEKAAALAQRESTARSLSSVTTGDQSVVYAASTISAAGLAADQARRFRSRTSVRTVRLQSPGSRPHLLRPEQADAGLGHAYSPEALELLGVEDY